MFHSPEDSTHSPPPRNERKRESDGEELPQAHTTNCLTVLILQEAKRIAHVLSSRDRDLGAESQVRFPAEL